MELEFCSPSECGNICHDDDLPFGFDLIPRSPDEEEFCKGLPDAFKVPGMVQMSISTSNPKKIRLFLEYDNSFRSFAIAKKKNMVALQARLNGNGEYRRVAIFGPSPEIDFPAVIGDELIDYGDVNICRVRFLKKRRTVQRNIDDY